MPKEPIDIRDVFRQISSSDSAQDDVHAKYDNFEIQLKEEELRKARLLNEALKGENEDNSQERGQRKNYAKNVFIFVMAYMVIVLAILFIQGFCTCFYLSDSVLITLLGTTTANVISVLVIVMAYLFSRKKKH